MTTFTAGQKVRASEINEHVLTTGMASADLTSTSDTTLSDVTGMSVAVEADSVYVLDGYVSYTCASATPDFKAAFSVPASTTGFWTLFGLDTADTAPGDVNTAYAAALTTTLVAGTDATLTQQSAIIYGFIDTAGTAGTVQFQAAQNTSSATAMTVEAGSWIRLQKVA
jgi:hypothetical protein